MAKKEKWFAVRRLGRGEYERIKGQPTEGFREVGEVIDWLESERYIGSLVESKNGERHREGWGEKYFASSGSYNDHPWEK